jgi:serine/threonine-protein kinase
VTGLLVLPPDILLVPVGQLPSGTRAKLDCQDSDVGITRVGRRGFSTIVDSSTAELLALFQAPKLIVDAVMAYCLKHDRKPDDVLKEAFPVLDRLCMLGVLVSPDDPGAEGLEPACRPGDLFQGWSVRRCVQLLEDTEVYELTQKTGVRAALKLHRYRPGQPLDSRRRAAWEREVRALRMLDGRVAPAVHDAGETELGLYILMDWCNGLTVDRVAKQLRGLRHGLARQELGSLLRSVLGAYVTLHELGLVHGDVHPRNVLVSLEGHEVCLVDLANARCPALAEEAPRVGLVGYFDPEFALARLTGQRVPPSTFEGEQYSLAVLLYYLATGVPYLELSATKQDEHWRQVAEEPPRAFPTECVWPELESVLRIALAKRPDARFPSISTFAEAVARACPCEDATGPTGGSTHRPLADRFIDAVCKRLAIDGDLFAEGIAIGPKASVNMGAAGVAYGLYRMSMARADPQLLAASEAWLVRAVDSSDLPDAFVDPSLGMDAESVGKAALYHSPTGIHLVRAFLSRAQGDVASLRHSVSAYSRSASAGPNGPDLTLGRAGVLLGFALLAENGTSPPESDISTHGTAVYGEVLAALEASTSVGPGRYLGVAHGQAGSLYAALRWQCANRLEPLPAIEQHLRSLEGYATRFRNKMSWPVGPGSRAEWPGWCHGTAGYVHLWTLCARQLGQRYLALAEAAAEHSFDAAGGGASLCCGLAGSGYAMLEMFRATGARRWLDRAKELAQRAVMVTPPNPESYIAHSLYKGDLGPAVLLAELEGREEPCMPLFGVEGWLPVNTAENLPT